MSDIEVYKKPPFLTRVKRSAPVRLVWGLTYYLSTVTAGVLLAASVLVCSIIHPLLRLSGKRGFFGKWPAGLVADKKGRVWAFGFGISSFRKLPPLLPEAKKEE